MEKNRMRLPGAVFLWILCTLSAVLAQPSDENRRARRILDATGIEGGLVVHIGCGEGKLTAALRGNDRSQDALQRYLVHGLDVRSENVKKARAHIQSLGLYGCVSAEPFDGQWLPYADNLVNLIVSENIGRVSMDEVMRVLAPGGVAYIKTDGQWLKTVKSRPDEIDEWTHFLYDASNNAVSKDSVVGPPRQLQWVAGPQWARSHDHLASVSVLVSSGGRIFYIVDEGPIVAVVLQPRWFLAARDAFSGVVLWKRAISKWQWHLRGFRSGPSDLSRRLVAVGDRVYVTLDIDGSLCALDAATGRTIRTYERTKGTLEAIHDQGNLYVVVGREPREQMPTEAPGQERRPGFVEVRSQRPGYREQQPPKAIVAIQAETGERLWIRSDSSTRELMPTTLAASKGRVFFQNADEIVCLDAGSGEDLWRAARPTSRSRPTWSAPTLVVYNDVVLSADRGVERRQEPGDDLSQPVEWVVSCAGGQAPVGELIAFSAVDGERLWSCPSRECYNAPIDVLVAGGLVWTGDLVRAKDPGITEGRDPITGQVKRTRPNDQAFFAAGMGHHRCYRNKATDRYLVLGRSGVEFIDVATGQAIPHHWTRGTCQYGVMPCNGLLYAPPHSCACFITAKLNGFNCLAPARPKSKDGSRKSEPVERGPAYGKISNFKFQISSESDWPTYRHDIARSGFTAAPVSASIRSTWETPLGGPLSSVVVADGKVFVAQIDAHTVHALDADAGRRMWRFVAGGRVDSPPTIWEGHAFFGSADGWVYCLRASDGELAWRSRVAPEDRRIVAYDQLESLWPVSGAVLVREGIVYCAAGRSSYLDGGIRLCRLDAKTGRMLSKTLIDDRDPETGYQRKGVVRGTNIPGLLPDVVSCDGESVYIRHVRFSLEGERLASDVPHLFSAAGFLDGTWWHRTYWLIGTAMTTSYGGWPRAGSQVPAGRLLVLDDSTVYGFGRNQYIPHGAHVGIDGATIFHYRPDRDAERRFTYYRAFAIPRESDAAPPGLANAKQRRTAGTPPKKYLWTRTLPVLARALVLAQDTLFMAGPPDVFAVDGPAVAFGNDRESLLYVASAEDGKELARYPLDSSPVFDGMAAAYGRLYISTEEGRVICFSEKTIASN
jgi:outer membrane protein assembly factor BamB